MATTPTPAARKRDPRWPPSPPPPALGPLFAAIACTVCATQTDLLSLTEMIEWGWSFAWTPEGHNLNLPGDRMILLDTPPRGQLAYFDLVLVPGTSADPKVTIFDAAEPSHHGLARHPFLIDTGAEHSLVSPATAHLLARRGSWPGVSCFGIVGNTALPVLDSGYRPGGRGFRCSRPRCSPQRIRCLHPGAHQRTRARLAGCA